MTGLDRKTLEDLYDLKRAMLRPDYSRMEEAHHIHRHPETYEVSWPPTGLLSELERLGLIQTVPPPRVALNYPGYKSSASLPMLRGIEDRIAEN